MSNLYYVIINLSRYKYEVFDVDNCYLVNKLF